MIYIYVGLNKRLTSGGNINATLQLNMHLFIEASTNTCFLKYIFTSCKLLVISNEFSL